MGAMGRDARRFYQMQILFNFACGGPDCKLLRNGVKIKPNLDCIYTFPIESAIIGNNIFIFPIDLELNRIPTGTKSIGKKVIATEI